MIVTDVYDLNDKEIDVRIPSALVNEENKILEESVETKAKVLSSLQLNLIENVDRIQMLEDHRKLVHDELGTIQRLLATCRREKTNELAHLNIENDEIKRIQRLMAVIENDLIKLHKRRIFFETEIHEINIEIEQVSRDTSGDNDKFERMIEQMKRNDDEAFCLMKYTQQDNIRIKELTSQLERYSERVLELKRATEQEQLEYYCRQAELDKIADVFRRSHQHRQHLIQRWEIMLVQMRQKDQNIDRLATELLEIKRKNRRTEQELNEKKTFFQREQTNNGLMKKLIGLANKKIVLLRTKQKTISDQQIHWQTDILSLKTVLINTENECKRERVAIQQLKTTLIHKQQELEKCQQLHQRTCDRKDFICNERYSIEEKLFKFDMLMANEEKYQNDLNIQYKKSCEKLFALNNKLIQIRQHEKQYTVENRACHNQIQQMKNHINQLDQQLLRQQESIYHQDFLKQTIDRRISRWLSEKTTDKYSEHDGKIHELQNDYNKKKLQSDQLQNQLKIVHDELRIIKRSLVQLVSEKADLDEKLLQFDVYINLSDKLIKKLDTEKADLLVEKNLLNVELRRLKDILRNSNETIANLEQQRVELQKALQERRLLVKANGQLFQLRLNDERTKKDSISSELAARITKITKLKHRYETFAMLLNTDQINDDSILAQAQHVIKTAKLKEDLLVQGDQLEALVIKAETELRALENTVQILNWNNIDVKKNFETLNESSSDVNEMKELEEHLRAVNEQVQIRQKLLKVSSVHESHTDLIVAQDKLEQSKRIIKQKQLVQAKLEDEIQQYRIKIDRAARNIESLQQAIRQKLNVQDIEQLELDVDIRVQNETFVKLEQQLTSLLMSVEDENVMDIAEKLSSKKFTKHRHKTSVIQTRKQQDQRDEDFISSSSSSSTLNVIPNVINIAVDKSPRETLQNRTILRRK